ncbi:MAG TPA: heme o synthase [Candidatus Saccharimonadales bacterium]|nr:heme o synthase [Candidatus Saccharimonadales bacterium]
MSVSTASKAPARSPACQRVADYLALAKPKIMLMELVTVAVAAVVAHSGVPDLWLLAHALLGTFLVAAGASAWNQWLERQSDGLMDRTAGRPLPAARLPGWEAALSGAAASLAGVAYLGLLVNLLTAALGALTWLIYVGIYTPLKSRSPANTAVGAVSGALPILMGWTAVGGCLNLTATALFLIVFLWQFPHVMAISWIYRRQYAAAGLKMSPVVDPTGLRAGAQAVAAALALTPVSLLPAMTGVAGPAYVIWVIVLSLGLLFCAAAFLLCRNDHTARTLFRASLIYLPALLLWLAAGPFR